MRARSFRELCSLGRRSRASGRTPAGATPPPRVLCVRAHRAQIHWLTCRGRPTAYDSPVIARRYLLASLHLPENAVVEEHYG